MKGFPTAVELGHVSETFIRDPSDGEEKDIIFIFDREEIHYCSLSRIESRLVEMSENEGREMAKEFEKEHKLFLKSSLDNKFLENIE